MVEVTAFRTSNYGFSRYAPNIHKHCNLIGAATIVAVNTSGYDQTLLQRAPPNSSKSEGRQCQTTWRLLNFAIYIALAAMLYLVYIYISETSVTTSP